MACGTCLDSVLNKHTPCDCPLTGYCTRHGIEKTDHWHHLCRNHFDYFLAWEEKRGPGQAESSDDGKVRVGLGDLVAVVIKIVTLGMVRPCRSCGSRRMRLNRKFNVMLPRWIGQWFVR
jgi:hypothetical protein